MIQFIIPLIGSFFTPAVVTHWYIPVLALGFVSTVPCIIRMIFRR